LAQRFETPDQLGFDAYYSLDKLRVKRPIAGYIRSSMQADNNNTAPPLVQLSEIKTKYEALLRENDRLQNARKALEQAIAEMKAPSSDAPSVVHKHRTLMDDYNDLLARNQLLEKQLLPLDDRPFDGYDKAIIRSGFGFSNAREITLGEIFLYVAEGLRKGRNKDLLSVVAFGLSVHAFINSSPHYRVKLIFHEACLLNDIA
jgi:hypothetical protein